MCTYDKCVYCINSKCYSYSWALSLSGDSANSVQSLQPHDLVELKMNFPLSEQHSFLSLCVFFLSHDLNLPLQSNPLLQSCLECTLLPCWYLSFCSLLFPFFLCLFPFPLQIWQFLLIHYTFNIIAFILPFSLPSSSLSLSCHLWLFVLLLMSWALPSHCVLVSVFVLKRPCCCDDLSLLQDSLTSHIFSFSPPPLPPKTTFIQAHGKPHFHGVSIELNKMCLTDSR